MSKRSLVEDEEDGFWQKRQSTLGMINESRPDQPDTSIDTVIQYNAILLQKGEMSVPYRTADANAQPFYVKKVSMANARFHGITTAMLQEEFNQNAQLRHVNIVHCIRSSYSPNNPFFYIVSEWIAGGTLAEKIDSNLAPSVAEVTAWLRQIAAALQYLHAQGAYHGNLTPRRIFLTDELQIKVTVPSILHTHTKVEAAIFTSPKQSYDGRDDMWAVGCILAELLLHTSIACFQPTDEHGKGARSAKISASPQWHALSQYPIAGRFGKAILDHAARADPFLGGQVLPRLLCSRGNERYSAPELGTVLAATNPTVEPSAVAQAAPAVPPPMPLPLNTTHSKENSGVLSAEPEELQAGVKSAQQSPPAMKLSVCAGPSVRAARPRLPLPIIADPSALPRLQQRRNQSHSGVDEILSCSQTVGASTSVPRTWAATASQTDLVASPCAPTHLRMSQQVICEQDALDWAVAGTAAADHRTRAGKSASRMLTEEQKEELKLTLEAYRRKWVTYWNYLPNDLVSSIVQSVPVTLDQLAPLPGMGATKTRCNGAGILAVVYAFLERAGMLYDYPEAVPPSLPECPTWRDPCSAEAENIRNQAFMGRNVSTWRRW